jgi:hypothetical protein
MKQENKMIRKKFSRKKKFPQQKNIRWRKSFNRGMQKTRRKIYPKYLVKWKDNPMEDTSWVIDPDILKHGKIVHEIIYESPLFF